MSTTARARAGELPRALAWLVPLLGVLFVASIPLGLVANNVRWVALSPDTYREGFAKYGASERTGLSPQQLEEVAQAFIRYFDGPVGSLEPVVVLRGVQRPLFNEREVMHMQDVQTLMQLVFRLGAGAGLYAALFALGLVLWRRGAAGRTLGRLFVWGSGVTFGLLVLIGGLSLVDFSELFVRFHQLSFRNNLWLLDPRRDYLLMLYPEGFWFDVTLRIAALTAGEAFVLGAVGIWLVRRARADRAIPKPLTG